MPKNKKKSEKMTDRLQVLIPDDMRERLDALRDGKSIGPIVREALDKYLKRKGY